MSWSFTRGEMCLPFHKTVARLWKIKWVGFITENLVQWLPSSKATAKHRCNSVQETAHRFPSSFWAGLAIQPAYPAEALHPIDLHGQQSLLAHAIGGLGQIGGWQLLLTSGGIRGLPGPLADYISVSHAHLPVIRLCVCTALSAFIPCCCTALTM